MSCRSFNFLIRVFLFSSVVNKLGKLVCLTGED